RIYTPPLNAGVLAGITRGRVIQLAEDLVHPVFETDVPISWVPLAEEMFLTGTASYVVPITHFGRHQLETDVGNFLNLKLRQVMSGQIEKYQHWNTVVRV
ncbi:MAG: aminotransferase class IV, partial [Proteobacteria bacterium]|nr:aminotransferase class IV [Pseudomonadota bacterium]